MSQTPVGRRRSAEVSQAGLRRRGLVMAAGLLVPAVTIASLLVVRPASPDQQVTAAPSRRPLVSQQLVCPPSLPEGTPRLLVSSSSAAGEIGLRAQGGDPTTVSVEPRAVAAADPEDAVVVDARRDLAPGVGAARVDGALGAAVACRPPRPDTWFTGLGAGSERGTVLYLTNPDAGPAIADVALYGPDGPVEVDDLRGVAIPGRETLEIDLSRVAPTRETLTAEVTAARGRVGANAIETLGDDGARWLAPEEIAPSADDDDEEEPVTTLLGLPRGDGERTLTVTNPSDDQIRVRVRIVGPEATFDPKDFDEIEVPPGATVDTDLTDVVDAAFETADDADLGLAVSSSTAVTAALTSTVGGGVDRTVDGGTLTRAETLVPRGSATAVLAAADAATRATVVAYDERGERLDRRTVSLVAGAAASLDLPDETASVSVESTEPIRGAVRSATDGGPVTLPLVQSVTTGLVPHVSLGR